MSSQPQLPQGDEREKLVARQKAQIWLFAIVMTLSFCVGTTIIFLILWLLLKNTP